MPSPEAHASSAGAPDDLQRRRQEIGRGLHRSHYAAVAASGMVGLIALAALWLGGEARHQAKEAQRASALFWQFGSRAAGLERMSRRAGQRLEALEVVREAAQWQPSRELRDEALSALLLPDVGTNLAWHQESGFAFAGAYDPRLDHFILNSDRQAAIVRQTADGKTLMQEKGLGAGTPFWQFSLDGRLAAIALTGGQIGVWDWRKTNLVGRFTSIPPTWLGQPFDFSPDGRGLWVLSNFEPLSTQHYLALHNLDSGKTEHAVALEHTARFVRVSPLGRWAALGSGNVVEVWDLTRRKLHATLALTKEVWCLAWQPGEERFAIGCEFGLHLWEVGSPKPVTLHPDATITALFFTPDGDQLFSAGWNMPGMIWNARDGQSLLKFSAVSPVQLASDQSRLAVAQARVGYGISQFLPPAGIRSRPGPCGMGRALWSADLDPQERWLVQACEGGWYIRAADSGKELIRVRQETTLAVQFSADGTNVLTWTSTGLHRWPLVMAEDTGAITAGSPQTIWSAGDAPADLGVFAADRRHASCSSGGRVTVVDMQRPAKPVRFALHLPPDNAHYLAPDGRWLLTGHHNQHGVDWYDCQTGKWLRRFAEEGFVSGVMFHPDRTRLFTCTAAGHSEWDPADGKLRRSVPWRVPLPYQDFLAFAPGGRLAVVKSSPSSIQLYDLETRRDFATLDFRDPQFIHTCHWSRDGQRLFLFGNDGGVTRVDLAALRAELERQGLHSLNWSDDDPSREFPADAKPASAVAADTALASQSGSQSSAWRNPPRLVWWVAAGLTITVAIGHYILRYQRKLFAGYLETGSLAEQRAEQLRDTHAALAHSEKMKALGTMAAGVAHDFNNLLSVIRLSSELIEEKTQAEGATKENFDAIQQAVQRGRGIVNSMLGYARDDGQWRAFAPGGLISDAVALLSKPFLSGVVLEIEVDPAAPEVTGRRGRVEQMLLNLVVNAAEAMAGRGTLRLNVREVSEAHGCVLPPRPAANYVELGIADSGSGIPPDVLPRIFEPFFTTKNQGAQHGTGLGLSMLYTMAKEDGVGVAVESEVGRGTTFRLFLPVEPARPTTADNHDAGPSAPPYS